MSAVVVIPIYKPNLTSPERISLTQLVKILGKHRLIFATHEYLDTRSYSALAPGASFAYFDKAFFESITGYNRLTLSPAFYQRFLFAEFLLIYQLDAFVFRDELDRWCSTGYSYIGSPWLGVLHLSDGWNISPWLALRMLLRGTWRDGVGNGGFSLRRTKSFLRILERFGAEAAAWKMNEDYFWSLAAPYWDPQFHVPSTSEALEFGFERQPHRAFARTKGRLPFGCHAWERHGIDFWQPFIPISPPIKQVG
jgi:hypothetical protein